MAKSNKKVLAKTDMNFFSGFASSSTISSSYTSLALLLLLGFFILAIGVYLFFWIRTVSIDKDITALRTELTSEEHQNQLNAYTKINSELATYNQQYYDISALLYKIDETSIVESKCMDTIQSNMPTDIIITDFTYSEGAVTLNGQAGSIYSPLAFINNIQKEGLFDSLEISSISQIDLSAYTPEEQASMLPYSFTIVGSLTATYPVNVTKMLDSTTPTPLTGVSSTSHVLNDTYSVDKVMTYTEGSNSYVLSKVVIDNTTLDANAFAAVQQADAITGTVKSSVNIILFYTQVTSNGGAQ